ncbi:MAG: M23 family metallopeptidase [Rhodanobacter sp.]
MIISPPFLPQHSASSPDDAWLTQAMNVGSLGDGAFPLGADLSWHGGVHLEAPRDGQKRLPACAIADGTVVYVRKPTAMPSSQADIDKHPLGYGSGWTDDGCVVIRHETEIGEGVAVCFFSITLHLKRIASSIKQGEKIWRKDELGEAGSIYGKSARIHFELICNDANQGALVGRASGALDTSKNGRTASLFGDVYLRLPGGTPFYDSIPMPSERIGFWAEATPVTAPAWSSSDALIVGVSLSRIRNRYTTRTLSGQMVGGTPAVADAALFDKASTLAKSQGAIGRDIYELLRFGRVIDPLGDSAGLTNWQQIAHPDGQGWVNLHAAGVHAFSDADFLDACGWHLIDDDANNDSRCDSNTLIGLMLQGEDAAGDATSRHAKALAKAGSAEVQTRLARTICKFPTEWEKATVAARWQWLTKEIPRGTDRMAGPYLKPEDFPRFNAHAEALCFWEEAALGIPARHWHFHPREFIRVFRQCGWLSKDEMIQLFPMTAMRPASHHQWVSEPVHPAQATLLQAHDELNKATRRYGIVTPLRIAAFYANATVETQWFLRLEEPPHGQRYLPWNGRGFMQLTWPDNYIKYWRFTGKSVDNEVAQRLHDAAKRADNERSNVPLADSTLHISEEMKDWRQAIGVARGPSPAADSAGAYWAWSQASTHADAEPANARTSKTASGATHVYYSSQGMGSVAATVNVGHPSASYNSVNGIVARFQAYNTCETVLLDTPQFADNSGKPQPIPDGYKPRHP